MIGIEEMTEFGRSGTATVPAMIAATAARLPDAIALRRGTESCTYARMMERADAVARGVLAAGVSAGDVVAVRGGRSLDTVVTMLGVLRSGAVLTMLDAAQSEGRARAVLDRAEPRLVIDTTGSPGDAQVRPADLERSGGDQPRLLAELDAGAPAYLCFTSGTTGEPRGVLGWHGALANFCAWEQRALHIGDGDRVAQMAALTFDAVFKDIFPALIGGATVCLPPTDRPFVDVAEVARWLGTDAVTVVQTVPSVLAALLAEMPAGTELPALRLICLSGEPLRGSLVSRWRQAVRGADTRFVNLYGTTEATILKSWYPVPAEDVAPGVLPVGTAIDGAELLVVNKRGRRCGPGEPGEVLIRTPFLTRGEWRPAPDAAPLFEVNPLNPDDPTDLVQRTGDLGRFGPHGDLEIHGRVDDQIKVLGVRVHPAEVAALISRLPGVRDAAVVVGDGDEPALIAYVVTAAGGGPDAMTIRQYVTQHGSSAMVPAAVVFLDRLPLTSHGKLDRTALPRPEAEAPQTEAHDDVAQWSETERRVAQVWSEVFKKDITSRHANFFELGGHSLMLARILARVRRTFEADLNLQALFQSPTVATLAAAVDAAIRDAAGTAEPEIVPVAREERQPLSPEQEGLWFLQQLEPDSSAYNMAGIFRLAGEVAAASVHAAFQTVCERHEALRLRFAEEEGRPVQSVAPAGVDFAELPPAADRAAAIAALQASSAEPFDLVAGPPVRVRVVRAGDREQFVGLTIHHLCCDGISWSRLTAEADALLTGTPQPGGRPLQFGDYVSWRVARTAADRAEADLAFWRDMLAGAPELDLPRGRPVPGDRPHVLRVLRRQVDAELWGLLAGLCRRTGATPYMAMMAALAAVLSRTAAQDTVVLGSDNAGRDRQELEDVVGFFVRTHAYRFDLSGDPTFEQLLDRVRNTLVGAAAHQEASYAQVVEAVSAARGGNRRPLFSVMLRTPPQEETPREHGVLIPVDVVATLGDGAGAAPTAKFDLTVVVRPGDQGALLDLEYDADALQPELVDALGARLVALLRFAVADPGVPLSRLRHGDHPFARKLAAEQFPGVGESFRRQAAATPEAVAVSWTGGEVTYRDLAAAVSGAMARMTSGTRVGIVGGKTPDTVACLIAALSSGTVPLLLDEALPGPRRQFMIERAGVERVLRAGPGDGPDDVSFGALASVPQPVVDLPAIRPQDPAYIFFTSGTTGEAKAVVGAHRGLDHFIAWETREFGVGPHDRVAQFTTLSFDAVLRDVFVPLTVGATLCLPPADILDDTRLTLQWLVRERVTIVHTTPSVAASWLREADADGPRPTALRLLCLAGEPLSGELVNELRSRLLDPAAEVVNFYGPTETTMIKTSYRVPAPAPAGPVPVGAAQPGAQVVVIGESGDPCQPGERGEIVIRTPYRTLGYLGDTPATSVFRPNPLTGDDDDLVYRTGDLATVEAGGGILVEGRKDDLLKVRGVRVHPAEISRLLAAHPDVRQAYVDAEKSADGVQLIAYVVRSAGSTVTTETLRQYARERLPLALVPALFLFLDRFTLLPNGKLDRASLTAGAEAPAPAQHVGPRDEIETAVWQTWAQLLGHEKFGVNDDFFAVGGHSLLATILITRLRKQHGITLSLRQLLETPTVDGLAGRVRELTAVTTDHASDVLLTLRPGRPGGPLLFLVHPIGGEALCYRALAAAVPPEFTVVGVRAPGLQGGPRYTSVQEMAAAYLHEVLRLQPQGPYHLGGWSMGGVVAYEMARQLSFEGAPTALLLLLDSYAPGSRAFEHFAQPGPARAASFARDLQRMTGENVDTAVLLGERPANDEADQMRRRFEVFDANATALTGYRLRRTSLGDTRVVLVRAADQERPEGTSATLGWAEALGAEIELRTVAATDHFTLLHEAGAAAIAAAVREPTADGPGSGGADA
ncbi:AMP-binding protein [Actinoplanes sp. NPDC049548]|uniref:AMP-binding protein n=1 Tax=Actinoplanes sp. NPDC049548 TaxID=3155152 RepID=UPI00341979EC